MRLENVWVILQFEVWAPEAMMVEGVASTLPIAVDYLRTTWAEAVAGPVQWGELETTGEHEARLDARVGEGDDERHVAFEMHRRILIRGSRRR